MFIGNANILGLRPVGGPSFTNEKSLLFDGVDEYVDLGSNTNITPDSSSGMSISFWYKFNVATGVQSVFENYGFTSNHVRVLFTSTELQCSVNRYSSGVAKHTFTRTTGQWYHIVITFDGTIGTATDRIKMFIDGSAVSVTGYAACPTLTPDWTTYPTGANYLGTRNGLIYFANGNIEEPAIFDYALTSGQVTSLYNSGTPTDLDNTSGVTAPVHWWRMGDGDTFPTINDVGTTGGNNGTMTNMESGDIVTDTP